MDDKEKARRTGKAILDARQLLADLKRKDDGKGHPDVVTQSLLNNFNEHLAALSTINGGHTSITLKNWDSADNRALYEALAKKPVPVLADV